MALQPGDTAPDFTAKDQDGLPVRLADFRGKKLVLYFYPRDMTPGCTAEACSLRDNYRSLLKAGYEVLGISTDNERSHKKFIEKEKLPFRLLADTDKNVHQQYGAWIEKSMYGRKYMGTARITYIINEQGIIEEIIGKVDTRNHADQILKNGPAKTVPLAKKTTPKKTAKSRSGKKKVKASPRRAGTSPKKAKKK